MSILKNIGVEVKDWKLNSNPPIGSLGYKDLKNCDFRIFYEVCESKDGITCNRCIFNWQADELCAHAPYCRSCDRKDKKNVYFKAIDIKPIDELL